MLAGVLHSCSLDPPVTDGPQNFLLEGGDVVVDDDRERFQIALQGFLALWVVCVCVCVHVFVCVFVWVVVCVSTSGKILYMHMLLCIWNGRRPLVTLPSLPLELSAILVSAQQTGAPSSCLDQGHCTYPA